MEKLIKIRTSDGPDAFDAALRIARGPDDVIQFVNVDQVETMGPWAFPEFNYRSIGRCRIDPGNARIVLSPNATRKTLSAGTLVDRPDRDIPIAFAERDAEILGGVWDCNHGAFRNSDPSKCWFTSGIRFEDGGDYTALGVTVIGMRGTYRNRGAETLNPDVEVFGISSNGLPGVGHLIRGLRCRGVRRRFLLLRHHVRWVDQDPDEPDPGRCNETRNGQWMPGRSRVKNWFAFSSNVETEDRNLGLYVDFLACKGRGVERGFHNDTGGTLARLRMVDLEGAWCDISIAGGIAADRRTVVVESCDLRSSTAIDLALSNGQATVIVRTSRVAAGTRHGSISGAGSILIDRQSLGGKSAVWQLLNGARQPIVLPDP